MDERSRPDSGPSTVVSDACDDIVSITNLLVMAHASAKAHCPDRVCISLMEQCISRLLTRQGLSRVCVHGLRMKECVEVPALLRVLRYARSEALHSLNDADCADLLAECIDRLTKTHELSQVLNSPTVALN